MTWDQLLPMLWEGTVETLYMTLWSSAIAYLIGLPLGVLLVVTRRGGIMPSVTFNAILGVAINFLRSIPFVIMIAVLFPVTRLVMGSSIGTRSVIFPLVISAFPYIARMVESSLAEVDHGIIEAAQSMGSTNRQIIFKVLLPEALPSLVNGAAISITTILGYTALGQHHRRRRLGYPGHRQGPQYPQVRHDVLRQPDAGVPGTDHHRLRHAHHAKPGP